MIIALILLGTFGCLFKLWLLWIIVSGLSRAKDEGRLCPLMIKIGTGIAYYALVWDVLCNVLPCTAIFADAPREPTLSQRLRRLVRATGWRQRFALWLAINLVNPFSVDRNDPHIHIEK